MDRLRVGMDHEAGTGVLAKCSSAPVASRVHRGFTLIELMVTITLMGLLLALAAPAMLSWIRNSKIRTTAEGLQSGLRQAQAEALRRSRQVSFSLTDSKPTAAVSDIEAKTDGSHWVIHVLPSMATVEAAELIESGVITDIGSGVQTVGPATVCFNSLGRLVPNDTAGIKAATGGATCSVDPDPAKAVLYEIKSPNSDRPLNVVVTVGGQVRMCDPKKTFSSTHPDGCA